MDTKKTIISLIDSLIIVCAFADGSWLTLDEVWNLISTLHRPESSDDPSTTFQQFSSMITQMVGHIYHSNCIL